MSRSFPPSDGVRSAATDRQPPSPSASVNSHNSLSSQSPPPPNHRPTNTHQHSQQPNPNFPPNHRSDHPPSPVKSPSGTCIKPNFIVQLVNPRISAASNRDNNLSYIARKQVIITLASLCGIPEKSVNVPQFGRIAGSFAFAQWVDALSAVVDLWDQRFRGKHGFVPELIPNVVVPSDMDELRERLCDLFSSYVRSLVRNSGIVKKLRSEVDEKSLQVESFSSKRGVNFEVFEKRKALEAEKDLLVKRLDEFKNAMKSIVRFLKGRDKSESYLEEEDVAVFNLEGSYDWPRIHSLIRRECRRLEAGLPIYTERRNILKWVHREQVTVLTGETGSGKSTQIVQFLADSGVAASGSIVCTQPRKIAAISLADRVREESNGCYDENSVSCKPSFSSTEKISSKVEFMTDTCLLQHYMKDQSLSGVSCVIIDEAHERSLNTDLLLALLKKLVLKRVDLRLVIMSATADPYKLSEYFFECRILRVTGRTFPVKIVYSPPSEAKKTTFVGRVASYVEDVVKRALKVHQEEKEGTILAFLTSQAEVETACEKFVASSTVALPLHGKLSFEEQFKVFLNYPGKRKVIFATNIAETSLTIPGVKFVIDCGMVKENKYEARTGMSLLKVCRVSKSSAQQRSGRAGRTEPGTCYRLYSESDFVSMDLNQEPEIKRVHLGVAILRILALGVNRIADFEFVDAPLPEAIAMAVRNLVHLGAVAEKGCENRVHVLTEEGHSMVKLGLEPKLGKLILGCFGERMGKEGIVLAALMANANSIFCRVGSQDDKMKADCRKVQFCNPNGDLFTLLSVYKKWSSLPRDWRSKWCWDNSVNAKSMRRCEETVKELEMCVQRELGLVTPSYWVWDPKEPSKRDQVLKSVILSSLAENVAMYTGNDHLGYEVALTGQPVQLHPSCSLLAFTQKPNYVVFDELLSTVNHYLVCVTAFDFEALDKLDHDKAFELNKRRLRVKKVSCCSSALLKRFCGRSNRSLVSIGSLARSLCEDVRISIQVNFEQNDILLYAPPPHMDKVLALVNNALDCEMKWMRTECIEMCIFPGQDALFGSGAQIKHLEVDQRFLSVDVFYYDNNSVIDDRELLTFLEKKINGCICSVDKSHEKDKWGKITFLTPESSMKATEIQIFDFNGLVFRVYPSLSSDGGTLKRSNFPKVTAKIRWPRRESRGEGLLKCSSRDIDIHGIYDWTSELAIGTQNARFERDRRSNDTIVVKNIDKDLSRAEVLDALQSAIGRRDLSFFLFRNKIAAQRLSPAAYADVLHRRIFACMSSKNSEPDCVQVKVYEPYEGAAFMLAFITFDGRLHLEAARALEELHGDVLPGCEPWQKIQCEQTFQSSIICPAYIYIKVKRQLHDLLASFQGQIGCSWYVEPFDNGAYRVKIWSSATRTIAEMRRKLEELIRGRPINHPGLTPKVLEHLSSKEGESLMWKIQRETETNIVFDKQNRTVRVCGSAEKVAEAEEELVQSLVAYHKRKQLEIRLNDIRPNLLTEVVERFGHDLQGIKEKVNGVELALNTRSHVIQVTESIEMRDEVEKIIIELAREESKPGKKQDNDIEAECPICLSEFDDVYTLSGCSHRFCKACLLEQFEASMRNFDAFPILCSHVGCGAPIVLDDMKALLTKEKLDELFRASLSSYVTSSNGKFRFCTTPDCPCIYRVTQESGQLFICGACNSETCTRCHLEYHPFVTCERYKLFKEDPDLSLKDWAKGKDVKECPFCMSTIEKSEGCNHLLCRCGKHICWVCLDFFTHQEPCYEHLRTIHGGIGILNDLGML